MNAPEPPRFPSVWSCYHMTPEQRETAYKRYETEMQEYGEKCLEFLIWLYSPDDRRAPHPNGVTD